MMSSIVGLFVVVLVLEQAATSPLATREGEARPLGALGQRLATRGRLQGSAGEPRLPLSTLQDLDAIKKVAQILVMLGEQVIPTIIGDSSPQPAHAPDCDSVPVEDVPTDPVNHN